MVLQYNWLCQMLLVCYWPLIYAFDVYSLISTRIATSGGVPVCIVQDSHVYQLGSPMSLEQVPSRYIVPSVKMFIIQDPSIKEVSF